ncbi:MAG: aminopeptidase, partial [Firmicutes bacterium]|nr:aminopeptidase [Bacillota bacterium]
MVSSERLRKYAELAVKTGANVQPGQMVIIRAELDQPEFVTMVQEECYKAGASYVLVQWSHQPSTVANMNGASVEALSVVYPWEEALLKYQTEHHPAMIHIISEDPDGLKGTDHAKRAQSQQARYKVIKPYREEMENKYQWTIVAVPGLAWARKVFPELSDIAAMEKLWDLILDISRVTDDPIGAWKLHNANTDSRCTYLNALGIRELHYTSANGTDLRVGMIPQA